jgi:transcriptional regulator with XRE-family HTH domain
MSKTVSYAQWALEPYCIGLKLRALRTQKRMTLSRLATETGFSTALLSKLETDRMIPTLPTLATICRVYGVGMSHFFTEPAHHTVSITRKVHLHGNSRGAESVKVTPLNPVSEQPRLIVQMIELSATGTSSSTEGRNDTCGIFYVLEGRLDLEAGGMHEILEAGDCVYIDSLMPIAMRASGKHSCRVLTVMPPRSNPQFRSGTDSAGSTEHVTRVLPVAG